jgi:lysozyme
MTASDLATARLVTEEGFRANAYHDAVGKLTIGYGFCIDEGISEPAARALLLAQVQERVAALDTYWWYQPLDEVRKSVIIDVSFNVGLAGLLHFPKMIAALGASNWQAAHDELLDSDAARLNVARYQKLATILLTGVNA